MIKPRYKYFPKRFLMNRNEYRFFKLLSSAVGSEYYIAPQVHLDELALPTGRGQTRLFSFRHINQKSVDFVLCSKNGLHPLLAIELDGISHNSEQTILRDTEVQAILQQIKLPLWRVKNNEQLTPDQIRSNVKEKLEKPGV